MKLLLAIFLGKTIAKLIHFLNLGGGSAAPGLYALKIEPELVSKLSTKIPKNIVITGTNGKTTTARMLAHFAKESGLKVIRNHTGSNLERGIASTLIQNTSFHVNVTHTRHGLDGHIGIWELDEAAFNTVAPKLKPDIVIFLNVFRDQLDRYGEVDSVVKNWSQTLKEMDPKTIVLINGDDSSLKNLKKSFKGKVQQFGVKDYKRVSKFRYENEFSSSAYKIVGESISHKKEKENLDFEAKNVKPNGLKGSNFQLTINDKQSLRSNDLKRLTINLPLPGIYHIYDALAAIACADKLGLPIHRYTDTLKHFQPAFGRVEKLPFGYIFLIKNPAGATQVFETIAPQIKPKDRLLLALNDNLADGTDVSWIWDANFERLSLRDHGVAKQSRLPRRYAPRNDVVVSGTRAYDLAVRLKYAGFDPKNIKVEPELENALKRSRKDLKGTLFILPTYTVMLELQGILTRSGIKKHYWEEDNI